MTKALFTLVGSRLRQRKAHSAVICAAVFLTLVLFMVVTCTVGQIFTGYKTTMLLEAGLDYHGFLRSHTFTIPVEQLKEALAGCRHVRDTAISASLTSWAWSEKEVATSHNYLRAMESEEALAHFFTYITAGRFPENDREILVNPLYFPDVQPGDKVTFYYASLGPYSAMSKEATFTVSGLMEGSTNVPLQGVLRYSDTLEETYQFGCMYSVYFSFDNEINLAGKFAALEEALADWRVADTVMGRLNQAYLGTEEALNFTTVVVIVLAVALVFLCSFLLIYNIYAIALTGDMQSFGMLHVIGTTHQQLRRLIMWESMLLYGITLPLGLTAGYFVGWRMVAPLLAGDMFAGELTLGVPWWVPVGAAVLALVTLLWSATRPMKKLERLSPTAAVDYHPATDLPKGYVRKKKYSRRQKVPTVGRLIRWSLARGGKKHIITALSLAISALLLTFFTTVTDYMTAYTYDTLRLTDFVVTHNTTIRYTESDLERANDNIDSGAGLSPEGIRELENSPFVANLWEIRTAVVTMETPARVKTVLRQAKSWINMIFWDEWYQEAENGKLRLAVVSIPDELWCHLTLDDGTNPERYTTGQVIYDGFTTANMPAKDHETRRPIHLFDDGDTITLGEKQYTVQRSTAGYLENELLGYMNTLFCEGTLLLPASEFTAAIGEGLVYAVLLDADPTVEGSYDRLQAEIAQKLERADYAVMPEVQTWFNRLVAESFTGKPEVVGYGTHTRGKFDDLDDMLTRFRAIETVGWLLVGFLFLIGILNVVNTALSSLTERKRELAMLTATGMTDRQMWRLLFGEAAGSSIVAVMLTVVMGIPLSILGRDAMWVPVDIRWDMGFVLIFLGLVFSVATALFACKKMTGRGSSLSERLREE